MMYSSAQFSDNEGKKGLKYPSILDFTSDKART